MVQFHSLLAFPGTLQRSVPRAPNTFQQLPGSCKPLLSCPASGWGEGKEDVLHRDSSWGLGPIN